MIRPNTRSKGRRSRSEPEEDISTSILRKIHITGEITPDDLQQLYLLAKPVCDSCRVNSKDNPNCFCGFIPPANGSRKSGLWQKMSEIIKSLGPNPCQDLRIPSKTPAGLTNLGATCYANSILQCLYMNTSFRIGIFSIEQDLLKQSPVLDELSRLFAQLHSSKMAFIDSAPFIKTLELDNGVQQDSHEFLTLFLSLLERSLRHSKAVKVRNMVQNLYCGRVSHVTQCSVCGRESDASSKLEDFYGLELNINGLNNLFESIQHYLSLENLNGENQYFCESCGRHVDATRCIKLRELPAILTFQLKRYVFHPKTTSRKKLTSPFRFPLRLNMGPSMGSSDASESSLNYDLAAILIHKGTAVSSGHYVAHVKDMGTGLWWEFDDEQVSLLGKDPLGKESPTPPVKACAVVQQIDHSGGLMDTISNGGHTLTLQTTSNCKSALSDEMFSSTDAYMLMYNHMKIDKESIRTLKSSEINADDMGASLPVHLFEEIQRLNTSYTNNCEEYQLKKESHITVITERRKEVKSVLAEAPVHAPEDLYFWISTDWLRQWTDCITPICIDNSTVQCSHGKLPISKIHSVKRVSYAAWEKLLSKYGGGPTLSNEDVCLDCIKYGAKDAISADDYRHRRTSLLQYAEHALAGNCSDSSVESLYYVSRPWLVNWLRRKNYDIPSDADISPTGPLRCPHGGLLPEHASGAKRVAIPENLWLFLYETANMVRSDDISGCLAFPLDTRPCEECSKELSKSAFVDDNLRSAKIRQRQNHEKLFLGKSFSLYPGFKYFLIPSKWLAKWRAYVTSTGKNVSSTEEPENLEVCIESFMCKKHMQLLERPPKLVWKRDTITQQITEDVFTVIPEDDWNLFCEEWNASAEKGISAEIISGNHISHDASRLCEEVPITEESRPLNDEENVLKLRNNPVIKTFPEICNECIGERESSELMCKLSYYNEDIYVYLISGKEPPKSLLSSSTTIQKPDRRTSKRSRKSRLGNSVNLKVSCSTSVYELKMMIWESFGVVKENQKLYKGLIEIDNDSAVLADKNIFPGDILWVTDSGLFENRDIAEELVEGKLQLKQAEGFHGTLLCTGVDIEEVQDIDV